MKTVFTDRAPVAHAWAHQTQPNARYRDNWRAEGRKLYSYSTVVGLRVRRPDNGSRIGEPVALLTGETYSVTTSRHMGSAWAATRGMERYAVADLDSLVRDGLANLADEWEAGRSPSIARRIAAAKRDADGRAWHPAYALERARNAVAAWIVSHARAIDSGADLAQNWQARGESTAAGFASILADMAGFTPKQLAAMIAKGKAAADAADALAAKRKRERELAEGKRVAAMPDSDFAATFPRDGTSTDSNDYHAREGATFARNLARLHKASKAAGYTSRTRELWRKLKAYRLHLAGREARIRAAYRSKLAAELRAWRNGEGSPPMSYTFARNPRLAAIHRRLVAHETEAAERKALETAERERERFNAWQASPATQPRPSEYAWAEGSPERLAILADMDSRRSAFLAAFDAWQAGTGERPAKLASADNRYRLGAPAADVVTNRDAPNADYRRATEANQAIATAEAAEAAEREAERERERNAERFARDAERRRAWLAGESDYSRDSSGRQLSDERGRALMRINGDNLETSWGATVPLAHAIRAFRFIKAMRESGRTWHRNGKTIRVGHYQVDAIEADGSFTAGCHSFAWPEVERVAILAGVADCPASEAAAEPSGLAA